jgi:hypothetical protein
MVALSLIASTREVWVVVGHFKFEFLTTTIYSDLSILTALIVSSLALDFIALLLLGVAITFSTLEQKGRLPKKFSRPKVMLCGKERRLEPFLYFDVVLAVVSLALWVSCVILAFTTPITLVNSSDS